MLHGGTLVHGRYRITGLLGKGGMGAVYDAIDERLCCRVALKQTVVSGGDLDLAFEREAKLLANLRHPALPRVLDYFSDTSGQFLVMEHFAGSDLAMLVTQRGAPFPPDMVLRWAVALLDALDYLHGQAPPVIHRDIKPQNIKLTDRDQIVLLDFGLAKGAIALQPDLTSGTLVHGYTRQYAPPEQIRGEDTDARSDLYALGATLYHLLTNKLPESAMDRMCAIASGQADPLQSAHAIAPPIPLAISEALTRAMALAPADRPASAVALHAALVGTRASIVQAASPSTPTAVDSRSQHWPIARITPATAGQARELAVWESSAANRDVAWSPDGEAIALASRDRVVRLWHAPDGTLIRSLIHSGPAMCVVWRPDGQFVASAGGYRDATVRVWRASDGSAVAALPQPAQIMSLAFAPDGESLAAALSDGSVRLLRLNDGMELLSIQTSADTVWAVAYAPDGRSLATGASDGYVRLWHAQEGTPLWELEALHVDIWSVAFAPDGRAIAAGASDGSIYLYRASDGAATATLSGHSGPVYRVAFAPDGETIATASQDQTVRLWRASDSALLAILTGHTDEVRGVAFAPDGHLLASCSADGTVRLWGSAISR